MSNTRICIKNLPKHLTDKRFKEHFAKFGEVTDSKIVKTADGRSRLFGFIGYTNENSTKNALSLNGTYLDTSKITVEMATKIDKSDAARPWSKYSEGSSLNKKKESTNSISQTAKSDKGSKKRKLGQDDDDDELDQLDNDPEFQKYKQLMMPRVNQKIWENDESSFNRQEAEDEGAAKKKKKIILDPKENKDLFKFDDDSDEEEELYDEMPVDLNNNNNNNSNSNNTDGDKQTEKPDPLVNDSSVNDLDWLKSKVSTSLSENIDSDDNNINSDNEDKDEEMKDDEDEDDNSEDDNGKENDKESESENEEEEKVDENSNEKPKSEEENGKKVLYQHESDYINDDDQVGESGRIFIRNLSHTIKEEDLENLFKRFGKISEIHLPIDNETKKPRGFAFILFLIPENAVRAMAEMDSKVYHGRIMHILPAKSAPVKMRVEADLNGSVNSSFKKQQQDKLKQGAGSTHNWNALFMRSDAIISSLSERYKISQGEILDTEAQDMAVRMTLMETHIINETKKFLEENGVVIDYIGDKNVKRSNTTILIKNIPFRTTEKEISDMFSKFGEITRNLLTPAKTLALVEFEQPNDAKVAFKSLAYTKFHHVPLYLEWAPLGLFKGPPPSKQNKDKEKKEKEESIQKEIAKNTTAKDALFYVFIKNLNWETTEDTLRIRLKTLKDFKSVKIATKANPKGGERLSCGYGFAEFSSKHGAYECIRNWNGATIDSHEISMKISDKTASINNEQLNGNSEKQTKKQERIEKDNSLQLKTSNKIIIKNIPFEATQKELRKLFSSYGEIQSLRLPNKPNGGHRGFGFIEFLTEEEAKSAIESLKNSHFYGRHLILQYAEQDKNMDELREKASMDYEKLKGSSKSKY
ncbi:RNA-binding region RNP-1 domain-containing protein [Tieghemostelium lacteum]|uniref:RNA-binding region RNP-1 domain-containing protein n=1 Tax=Tieghemostelium lacteum TaxID=361077 RepID=A0A151ZJX8_TIELA|nr:RNA-binding region RNP-1 domain-containing protein [Tieghemostelium lacteum]|eukprot:KYQ94283.1 RNA-binding region RNP-1 domain-containing protein [Tieghemostelium lacteum]